MPQPPSTGVRQEEDLWGIKTRFRWSWSCPGGAADGVGARDPLPDWSASSRELLVDPGVRFRRLDAARQGNLIREKLTCFPEELPFARRELRLGAFRGQRPLATRAVTDVCQPRWPAAAAAR